MWTCNRTSKIYVILRSTSLHFHLHIVYVPIRHIIVTVLTSVGFGCQMEFLIGQLTRMARDLIFAVLKTWILDQ